MNPNQQAVKIAFARFDRIFALQAPATLKLILLALAYHSNAKHQSYPSIPLLALETGLARRTLQSGLRRLESMGWIATAQRGFKASFYTITLPNRGAAYAPPRAVRAPITVKEQSVKPKPWQSALESNVRRFPLKARP